MRDPELVAFDHVLVHDGDLALASDERGPLLEHLGLVVVVDAEMEQDVVLVLGQRAHQLLFRRLRTQTRLHQRPERRVVQVVDVAVHLSPSEVVLDALEARVEHHPAVEGGQQREADRREDVAVLLAVRQRHYLSDVLLCAGIQPPVVHVGCGEGGNERRHDLVLSAVEEHGLGPQQERVLVGVAVRQHAVWKEAHRVRSRLVHHLQSERIVRLAEVVALRELVEPAPVETHHHIALRKQRRVALERLHVLVLGVGHSRTVSRYAQQADMHSIETFFSVAI